MNAKQYIRSGREIYVQRLKPIRAAFPLFFKEHKGALRNIKCFTACNKHPFDPFGEKNMVLAITVGKYS